MAVGHSPKPDKNNAKSGMTTRSRLHATSVASDVNVTQTTGTSTSSRTDVSTTSSKTSKSNAKGAAATKSIRGGKKAINTSQKPGPSRQTTPADQRTLAESSINSAPATPDRDSNTPAKTPTTVVRNHNTGTHHRASLANKAAASGLSHAHRYLSNREEKQRVTRHESIVFKPRPYLPKPDQRSLDFEPILPQVDYSEQQRELFHLSNLQNTVHLGDTADAGQNETRRTEEPDTPVKSDDEVRKEALRTNYDSVAEIRASLNRLANHLDNMGGSAATEVKAELLEVQQDLIKRITDHCLLRGHLFMAEGKITQGELLLQMDAELKKQAMELLTVISALTDTEENTLRASRVSRDRGSKQKFEDNNAMNNQNGGNRQTKNDFKSCKSSQRSRAREQEKFQKELTRRSINNANLESTRDGGRYKDKSKLEEYLEQASRSRLNVPGRVLSERGFLNKKPRTQRVASASAAAEHIHSGNGYNHNHRREANTSPSKPKMSNDYREAEAFHGETAEDPEFYAFLPEPWDKLPDQSGQTFNQLLALQRNNILPTFTGVQAQYQNFRTLFIMMVHSARVGLFAKDVLLRKALEHCQPVQTLLAAAPPGPRGYAMLVNRLEEKFGGSTKLLNHYLTKLRKINQVLEGHVDNLEELLDNAHGYHAALASWGAQDATTHSHFTFILNKFSPNLRLKYHLYVAEHPGNYQHDVDHLLAWAQKYLLQPWRLEPLAYKKPQERGMPAGRGQQFARQQPDRPAAPAVDKFRQQVPPGRHYQAQKQGCPKCKSEHGLAQCKQFQKLDAEQRMEVVMKAAACFRCLNVGHRSRTCKIANPCQKCKNKHHTLLHEFLAAQDKAPDLRGAGVQLKAFPTQEEEDNRGQELLQEADLVPDQLPTDQDLQNIAAQMPDDYRINFMRCYQLDSPSEVISLRFAVVTLVNVETGQQATVGALLDDGANVTIISERVATLLNLTGKQIRHGSPGSRWQPTTSQNFGESSKVEISSMERLPKNIVVQDPYQTLQVD